MRQTGQGNGPVTAPPCAPDDKVPLTMIYRLPQTFRWITGRSGGRVETCLESGIHHDSALVGLKVISGQGSNMALLSQLCDLLAELRISTTLALWEEELCLFIAREDESVTLCHLKGYGVAVVENLAFVYLC